MYIFSQKVSCVKDYIQYKSAHVLFIVACCMMVHVIASTNAGYLNQ